MKRRSKRMLVTIAGICAVLLIASFVAPSGICWATVFGTDFAMSTSNGNLNVSVGKGGFYYWWEAFAEREYEARYFGMGYDSDESLNSDWRFLPAVLRPEEWWPPILVFPLWILVAVLLGSVRAFGGARNKQAEQGADGQAAAALE